MNFFEYISHWVNTNPGKAAGAAAGLVLSVLLLTIGIVKTLLILLFILAGFIIGKSIDDRESLIESIKNIFNRK